MFWCSSRGSLLNRSWCMLSAAMSRLMVQSSRYREVSSRSSPRKCALFGLRASRSASQTRRSGTQTLATRTICPTRTSLSRPRPGSDCMLSGEATSFTPLPVASEIFRLRAATHLGAGCHAASQGIVLERTSCAFGYRRCACGEVPAGGAWHRDP